MRSSDSESIERLHGARVGRVGLAPLVQRSGPSFAHEGPSRPELHRRGKPPHSAPRQILDAVLPGTFMNRGAELVPAELRVQPAWRYVPVLAAGLAVLGILALFWQTAGSIVAIWLRSETFAHGFVVVPICLWLAWREREALAQIPAKPWWPGLAVRVAGAGALWLVTSVADVLGLKQFALAFMVQAAIVTVLGTGVARALVFPLAFLLFAVPGGRVPGADADRLDRGFHHQRTALVRRSGVSGGEPLRHSFGPVVGGRGLQRHPLHHRLAHGGNDLRRDRLPQHASRA